MEIVTIIGARPQLIKAAALSHSIINKDFSNFFSERILHTGQHFDKSMSGQFFTELSIPKPYINLGVYGGGHGQNTGRMLELIERELITIKPDAVIVYGDTNSTLAGALAASKLNINVIHIEAGLRSFNKKMPEEKNRIVTDHLSDLCFTPTEAGKINLINEGISQLKIIHTGDLMADSIRIFSEKALKNQKLINNLNIKNKEFILATIHRAENTDDHQRLKSILSALGKCNHPVVLPMHPRTKSRIKSFGFEELLLPLIVIDPVGFFDMLLLERNSSLVVTDSGGVQKEAYLQKTPCLTIRTETEWSELIQTGWNKLADPYDEMSILKAIKSHLFFDRKTPRPNFYGDGHAAEQILNHFKKHLSKI